MVMTDPIADMLTRLRNANSVFHEKVEIPVQNQKGNCCRFEGRRIY